MDLRYPAPESDWDADTSSAPPSPRTSDSRSLLASVAGHPFDVEDLEDAADVPAFTWDHFRAIKGGVDEQSEAPWLPSELPSDLPLDSSTTEIVDVSVVTLPSSSEEDLSPPRPPGDVDPEIRQTVTKQTVVETVEPAPEGLTQAVPTSDILAQNGALLRAPGLRKWCWRALFAIAFTGCIPPLEKSATLMPPSIPVDRVDVFNFETCHVPLVPTPRPRTAHAEPASIAAATVAPLVFEYPDFPDEVLLMPSKPLPVNVTALLLLAVTITGFWLVVRRQRLKRNPSRRATPRQMRVRQMHRQACATVTSLTLQVPAADHHRESFGSVDGDGSAAGDTAYNVCLLGGRRVGISSLLSRQLFGDKVDCLTDHIKESYRQAYKKRGARTITLALCDWHEAKTRRDVGRQALHVAVVVFAMDDQATLTAAIHTVRQLKQVGTETGELCAIFLVGNKSDLLDGTASAIDTRIAKIAGKAQHLAEREQITYVPVSAKTGAGVRDLFRMIARRLRDDDPRW